MKMHIYSQRLLVIAVLLPCLDFMLAFATQLREGILGCDFGIWPTGLLKIDTRAEVGQQVDILLMSSWFPFSWRISASEALKHPWLSDHKLHARLSAQVSKPSCFSSFFSCFVMI